MRSDAIANEALIERRAAMRPLYDFGAPLARLRAGDTIVMHSGCAEPCVLAEQIARHAAALRGVRLVTLMPMGRAPYGEEGPAQLLDIMTFFPGRGLRSAFNAGRVRPLRYPLSAIPSLFDLGVLHADVVMLQVSSPDETGHVSLGVSVDYMWSVLAQAPTVIAEVNPRMPNTCGHSRLHVSRIDWFVEATEGPQVVTPAAADEIDDRIAQNVARLVPDGAVLQVGIGSLPDRVLAHLGHLKHLGLHTGIITDAARPLIEAGVIDNSTKKSFPGVSVTTMAAGTQAFYDFLDRNRAIEFHPCSLTHRAETLAEIENFRAINSALQVDLSGQVNAEEVGGRRLSMPGGLPDFATGASRAPGGASILAVRSTFGKAAASNIVPRLKEGAPVTVSLSAVDFVVTEHGVARLRGVSEEIRARAIIAIAHPNHRESLERELASSNGRS